MVEIQIKYETGSLISKKNLIKKIVRKHLNYRKVKKDEISILITTDKRIKYLNRKYRNINRPTDVLSFSQHSRSQISIFNKKNWMLPILPLGDIVISAETLKRQAKIYNNNSIDNELKLLVTHGIDHLLGFHHKGDGK